ncbi:MAG: hypothetical protein M9962_08900 [Oligoflexia bacterium]|nr:hypothetical protein [Oligoflexia bacterium]
MKTLVSVVLLSLFIGLPAKAFQLTCYTEYLTTTFVIWTENEDLYARVIHHNGAEYAPAIVGIYTPKDIPILERRANLVKQMQNETTFRWKKEKCKFREGNRFECFGTDDIQYGRGGEKIEPFALYSTEVAENGIAGKLNYLWLRLTFDVDGESGPAVEMEYPTFQCVNRKLTDKELIERTRKPPRSSSKMESRFSDIHRLGAR